MVRRLNRLAELRAALLQLYKALANIDGLFCDCCLKVKRTAYNKIINDGDDKRKFIVIQGGKSGLDRED